MHLHSDPHRATLQVRYHGVGIPATEQANILEAFQRGSNAGDIPGTGLGLPIVKVCVDLHRGSWHIDSKEGQGTTVSVTLPLE